MATNLITRSYSGPGDLRIMVDLAQSLRACGQMIYPTAADLHEELADPAAAATARIWMNQRSEMVGFVYVSPWQNLVDVFTANELTNAVEAELIEWAVDAVRRRNEQTGSNHSLDASALESDQWRLDFLERHGFERQAEASILMARPLSEPIPVAHVPPGFTIRPVGGEAEIDAYVALHRAAFGAGQMNTDYRRAIMNTPGYLPELDLVAAAPDGRLAAFCVCQIFPDDRPRAGGQNEGWTDPIGTHPDYQRLGLAKALILTGMNLLQERGIDTALLGTSIENFAMQHTAEAVGFRQVSKTVWYQKAISRSPG